MSSLFWIGNGFYQIGKGFSIIGKYFFSTFIRKNVDNNNDEEIKKDPPIFNNSWNSNMGWGGITMWHSSSKLSIPMDISKNIKTFSNDGHFCIEIDGKVCQSDDDELIDLLSEHEKVIEKIKKRIKEIVCDVESQNDE